MLDATLTTDFQPGTNLKGGAAGANWTYLLPSLELDQVVTVGEPPTTTLATLSRCTKRTLVLCSHPARFESLQRTILRCGLENVTLLSPSNRYRAVIKDRSTDLVFVVRRFGSQFARHLSSQWQRWLTPQGLVYYETSGLAYHFLRNAERDGGTFHDSQSFWLTPLSGESHTFIPLQDHETIRFFREQRLTSPVLRPATFKSHRRRREPRSWRVQPATRSASRSAGDPTRFIKTALRAAVRGCNGSEQLLYGSRLLRGSLGRRGVFVGAGASRLGQAPPQYLQTIARQSGVSIASHRWGLSASGDYDSRKLVFFLFDGEQAAPAYVVKMTRSSSFNRRLDQERRGLQLLEEKGIGDRETLPRVAFAGTHGGLSIVGETAIDGVPFDRRTKATASCPYAHAAVDWLTDLGAATAIPFAANPSEIARGMRQLLSRFAELYAISAEETAFLQSQISVIEFTGMPLVFQHGDPGRWNVFVTSNHRIGFLDWEASEPNGIPLWDLFYFLRSFCVCVAQSLHHRPDSLRSLNQLLLEQTPLAEFVVDSARRYCDAVGLSERLIEPLFYTCWMHRALKEATRLPATKLREGHYFNLLRLCMERRESPTLARMFATN